MKYYPDRANFSYDKNYYTDGITYDIHAHASENGIFQEQVDMIENILGSLKDKYLLDIGGALGWFAKRCQDKGAIAYCQDISLWACQNSPIPNYMVCHDAGDGILFPDSKFDIVTAIESLEHIKNITFCFEEISRVLKPNGLFYCSVGSGENREHVWICAVEEWEKLINDTKELYIDTELTEKFRQYPLVKNYGWNAIVARKE